MPIVPATTFTSIIIPGKNTTNSRQGTTTQVPFPQAYKKIKDFMKTMLRNIIERMQTHPDEKCNPLFKELGAVALVDQLRVQLEAFWLGQHPFNMPIRDGLNPLEWWKQL